MDFFKGKNKDDKKCTFISMLNCVENIQAMYTNVATKRKGVCSKRYSNSGESKKKCTNMQYSTSALFAFS